MGNRRDHDRPPAGNLMQRIVCHLDMDAFFASVEEKHDPSLRGKPVLVAAGPVGRGAVASCNYVARRMGIKTGMATSVALRDFPGAVVVLANYDRYQEASEQILRIIYRFTPDVEPLSLDEAFFELTRVQHRWPEADDRASVALEVARAIQKTIDDELDLGASIGISSGKALAKMASDFKKPHGITVVPFGYEIDWIDPLPIEAVPGVGHATHRKLSELGVVTCGDLCKIGHGVLLTLFGNVHGNFLWNLVRGIDERPLQKRGAAKSISHQSTLQKTTSDKDYVESILLYIAERCLWRLRAAHQRTRGVSVFVRFASNGRAYPDGGSFGVRLSQDGYATRVVHLKEGIQSEQIVLPRVSEMVQDIWREHPNPKIDFLGVRLFDFEPVREQEELFVSDDVRKEILSRTLGNIRDKFGASIITSARTFGLHHSYRLSQAGLSFTVMKVEDEEAKRIERKEAAKRVKMETV